MAVKFALRWRTKALQPMFEPAPPGHDVQVDDFAGQEPRGRRSVARKADGFRVAVEHDRREVIVPRWYRPAVWLQSLAPSAFARAHARVGPQDT